MNKAKKKINLSYWLLFFVAIVSLSRFFGGHEALNSSNAVFIIGSSLFIFLTSIFLLAFIIYAEEKDANNLRSNFGPYEFLYKKFWSKLNG